jgi:hypothetical protein
VTKGRKHAGCEATTIDLEVWVLRDLVRLEVTDSAPGFHRESNRRVRHGERGQAEPPHLPPRACAQRPPPGTHGPAVGPPRTARQDRPRRPRVDRLVERFALPKERLRRRSVGPWPDDAGFEFPAAGPELLKRFGRWFRVRLPNAVVLLELEVEDAPRHSRPRKRSAEQHESADFLTLVGDRYCKVLRQLQRGGWMGAVERVDTSARPTRLSRRSPIASRPGRPKGRRDQRCSNDWSILLPIARKTDQSMLEPAAGSLSRCLSRWAVPPPSLLCRPLLRTGPGRSGGLPGTARRDPRSP